MRPVVLGTGASGGTPGHRRSRRLESSPLISNGTVPLIDVTRDFSLQAERLGRIDTVLRVSPGARSLVYASSDVAQLAPELEACVGATVLVLDGPMWRRRLFAITIR